MKIKTQLLLLIAFNLSMTFLGQNKFYQEEVFIHVDKKLLVPGDLLKFNFFVRNIEDGKLSEDSDVLYVSLYNQRSERKWTQKLLVNNGIASGDFMMPSDWISGKYLIEAHTFAMEAYSERAFSTLELFFYNPFREPKREALSQKSIKKPTSNLNSNSEKLSLNFDHRTYGKRARVNFELKSNTENGLESYFSLNVSLVELHDIVRDTLETETLDFDHQPQFEKGGERYSVFVQNLEAEPAEGQYVAMSIPDDPFRLLFARTNQDGLTNFFIPENRLSSEVYVQVYGKDHEDFTINFLDKEIKEFHPKWMNSIELSESDKYVLSDYAIKNQIEASFYNLKSHRLLNKNDDSGQMDLSSKEVFNLDDYNRFSSLKETFTEVIKEASISKKGGKLISSETDVKTKYPTLILFNGILSQEYEQLMEYNAGQIDRVEIFRNPYSFYSQNFHGLIEVFSIDPELRLYANGSYLAVRSIPPPNKGKRYYNQRYDTGDWENIPDFRRTLFWQAPVYVRGLSQQLSVYTSDVIGWYKVELIGLSKNGELTQIIDYFEVK